jgi:hypothetical protein
MHFEQNGHHPETAHLATQAVFFLVFCAACLAVAACIADFAVPPRGAGEKSVLLSGPAVKSP